MSGIIYDPILNKIRKSDKRFRDDNGALWDLTVDTDGVLNTDLVSGGTAPVIMTGNPIGLGLLFTYTI
jgi:hypothetical protein